MDLFSYPHAPGAKARETSFEAARSIKPAADRLRRLTLDALRQRPMTADEVATSLGLDKLSVRPRISELAKQGKVIETGLRRANASGKSAMVWRAL